MPIINPRPRTSPTILKFFVQSAKRPKRYSPMRRAFSLYSLSIRSMVASAAARHTAGNALRRAKNVRLDSRVFASPPLSGAAHARLHFVHDEHDAVLPADALQFLQKELWCGHIAAFALNGLDDDARNVLGIEQPLENLPFELFENLRAASLRGVAVRAAIRVRIRDVLDAAEQGAESLALRRFRRWQRERAHRAPVEAAVKRDELVPFGGVSRQLNGALDRFCS